MKKLLSAFVLALLVSAPAFADCNPGGTTGEMKECAAQDYAKADKALNEVYQQLASSLSKEPAMKEALKKSELAWIAFRDAECDYETSDSIGGTIHGLERLGCLQQVTETRTQQLQSNQR